MEVFFGMLGAAAGMALYCAGWERGRRTAAPAAADREALRAMEEGQRAFRQMQNYSAEQAYGLLGRGEEL